MRFDRWWKEPFKNCCLHLPTSQPLLLGIKTLSLPYFMTFKKPKMQFSGFTVKNWLKVWNWAKYKQCFYTEFGGSPKTSNKYMPTIVTIQYSHGQTLVTGWYFPLVLLVSPLHSLMERQLIPSKELSSAKLPGGKKTDWKKLTLVGSLAPGPGAPHNAKTKSHSNGWLHLTPPLNYSLFHKWTLTENGSQLKACGKLS